MCVCDFRNQHSTHYIWVGKFFFTCASTYFINGEFWGKCKCICQCCDAIAATYGLTPREHEIIVMLAHNRTVNDIAGDLIISVRTVNTHMNNIYGKLDIHSRNELSDLLRSTQSDMR